MLSTKNSFLIGLWVLNTVFITCLVFFGDLLFENPSLIIWSEIGVVLLFFYEMMVIILTDKKRKVLTGKQSVNFFLGLKVGKIILSLLFIGIFVIAVRIEVKRFVLVFVSIYLVYLLFDTIYLACMEKDSKKQLKNE